MEIKPSAFSHSWYPGTAGECRAAITALIRENVREGLPDLPEDLFGGIVPHAGWTYSGRIACRVIEALARGGQAVDTVILFGSHLHPSQPGFVLASGGVATPLGPIEVDPDLALALAESGQVNPLSPKTFPDENTLELQYPFIRYFFPKSRLVAAGAPPSHLARQMGEMAVAAAQKLGRQVRILGSTDMTHYGPNFGFAPAGQGQEALDWVRDENDALAIEALIRMDEAAIVHQGLSRQSLCCAGAAVAAAAASKKLGAAKGICLDYATSYEVSRSRSFVGYCGVLFGPG